MGSVDLLEINAKVKIIVEKKIFIVVVALWVIS
jgi:hypothetical protein